MKPVSQFLHHRSLTLSFATLFCALVSTPFLPEHVYRLQHQGLAYLRPAAITVIFGLIICIITLIRLIKDAASDYSSTRCSIATLLWALGCVPILFLWLVVISALNIVSL